LAPALCGPTRSAPPVSIQAIEPPPAPIDWTSTPATPIGWNSTWIERDIAGRPSRIRQTSKLVPPMSTVITLPSPP
jgi:hypothetical protein